MLHNGSLKNEWAFTVAVIRCIGLLNLVLRYGVTELLRDNFRNCFWKNYLSLFSFPELWVLRRISLIKQTENIKVTKFMLMLQLTCVILYIYSCVT